MKNSSTSSRPDRLTSMKAEDIFNRPLTEPEKEVLRRLARRQAAGDDSHINYEDAPPLSDEQLSKIVRFRDARRPKVAVSVRLDASVLESLKGKGEGHLTRINDILANVMEAEQRMSRKG